VKLLTLARNLRRRKAREREEMFVVEGVRAVEELLRSPLSVAGVLVGSQLSDVPRGAALLELVRARQLPTDEVPEREFHTAAETESPQGILAIVAVPKRGLDDIPVAGALRLVVLDAVQDPGNVGTIVRTAAALGATATVALPGTVDLWNAKVVRSAMGAHFHHLAFHCTWDGLESFLSGQSIPLWAAEKSGVPLGQLSKPTRIALAVGNEGSGLSDHIRDKAEQTVSLPIAPEVESLNVAVATGILLYELAK
jgi:TrmH family RNA methyltransferase